MNGEKLIECFRHTYEYSFCDALRFDTQKAIESTCVYREAFMAVTRKNDYQADIIVEENTSFAAAMKYKEFGRIAVLNFANPEYPGGGVRNGAMAQEECLCRSSNLYPCLCDVNVFNDFYEYHRNLKNTFYSDRLIYTKDITVFKNDNDVPQMLPEDMWFKVDVITCSAPYIAKRKYTNPTALLLLFKSRIKNIFEAAIENGAAVLILGAFGCGAFKNPPEVVAKAFREVIQENSYQRLFKKIVFAIKKTDKIPCPNLMAFEYEFYGISAEANILRFTMPCGCDSADREFDEWQRNNPYFKKQFSILGDSISTLDGYNPRGYKVFYSGDNCVKSGVSEMADTWWGKVIDFLGGELLVNNSWSGSRVTRLPESETLFPSGCSDERTGNLHINNVKPDVVIIYLGTNDWAFGAEESYTEKVLDDDYHCISFGFAYSTMIGKIRANYPDAEIWCCTLNTTFMSSNSFFSFPYKYGGSHIEEYNKIIINTALSCGCKIINLYDYNMPYDSIDGSHPNKDGMNTLAAMIIRSVIGIESEKFIDCRNEQHDYEMYCQTGDYDFYICKKCGKKKQVTVYGDEIIQTEDQQDAYLGSFVDERYYVIRLIVRCRTYSVYSAKDVRSNSIFVLKAYDKTNISFSSRFRDNIFRESFVLMRLNHPSIPRIIDVIEDEKSIFIIREYVDGISLDSVVKKYGPQSAEIVVNWAKQICSALGYLHSFNPPYIYNDMNPNNLILRSDGVIEIINFGMMRAYDPFKGEDTHILRARMGYVAPEQFGGYQSDVRTDIYGIGMTMHNLVTGIDPTLPPYETRPICEINPSLPKGLEYIISKCIEMNPGNRYQSCVELLEDLDRYRELPRAKGFFSKLFRRRNIE